MDLLEYQTYDKKKFMARWDSENKPYENEIGADGENFQSWLEKYDPTPNNKYVNWLTVRYLKSDIKRLEDIPSRIGPALKKYLGLQQKKKLKPEHKNLNSIRNIEDVMDEYQEVGQSNRQQAKSEEKQFYDTDGAKLLLNTEEYKVVIPKTEKASCFFGKNTRWCTAARTNNWFNHYNKDGDLYIILHKPTNRRWQFHFESRQFMDERDEGINVISFYIEHPVIVNLFVRLKKLKFEKIDGGVIMNDRYYNNEGQLHRLDGPTIEWEDGSKSWYRNGEYHREDGPAIETASGTKRWYRNGKLHREDGPAYEEPDGTKKWYRNDNIHREDGPAVIAADGDHQWYLNDKRYRTFGRWLKALDVSDEQKSALKRKYGKK